MQFSYVIFTLGMTLLVQTVYGLDYRNFLSDASFLAGSSVSTTDFQPSSDSLDLSSEKSDLYHNSSELRAEMPENDTSLETDQANSTSPVSDQSQNAENSTNSVISFSSTHKVTTVTETFSNESQSSISTTGGTISAHSMTSKTQEINESLPTTNSSVSDDDDEPEGVARGKPSTTESVNATALKSETLYQKTLALISDTYTLSILVPVAAGVVFASTILVTIAICRCVRRRCRRRRLHRKALPDSVKNLRPSDRARLLAESSDEEF